jgi:UDP-N-acetylmuramyl pentapeptide phosphotransferase/UDP-N-acetylglucosamine-1-phosphate transferase
MALCGMAVGCISYGLYNGLLFQPNYILPDLQMLDVDELSPKLHDAGGMPRLAGFVVFFGILFGALRWWRQSDPTRHFRLSIFSTAVCVVAAIMLQAVCPLPQAFLIAGATAIAVQMSSPWMTREERHDIREELIAMEVEGESEDVKTEQLA